MDDGHRTTCRVVRLPVCSFKSPFLYVRRFLRGLDDALREHGRPKVFNSDQGSQFISKAFTGVLQREGIAISMDGRGVSVCSATP